MNPIALLTSSSWSRFFAIVLFFVTCTCAWSQTLGERKTVPGGAFTLRFPDGWKLQELAEKKALHAVGTNDRAIQARDIEFGGPVQELKDQSMEVLKKNFEEFKLLDSEPFKTKSGMNGVLVHFEAAKKGVKIRQMMFLLDGRPGHKAFITCGFLANADTKENRTLYEEVASSIRLD
jgi:hypothetical protein